jgi:RNA polymerase sigma-70 factor (ECF subfamily)
MVQPGLRTADQKRNGIGRRGRMGTGLPFDDVLLAAQAGGAWAFEVLYRDLSPTVTGYLRLHGAVEPDDLASETFLGVFTGLAGFTGDESDLRAWVFTIAHRRLVDDWRRRSRRPQLADEPGDLAEHVGGDVEEDVLVRVGAENVERMCGGLPADQRSVLLLRILADLTVEQVAQVLGKSVASVKALQRRGLRTLRDRIESDSRKVFEESSRRSAPLRAVPAMTGMR